MKAISIILTAASVAISSRIHAETWGWGPTAAMDGVTDVFRLLQAEDGSIYAGTAPRCGVFRTGGGGGSWIQAAELPGATHVLAMTETAEGSILAGTAPSGAVFRKAGGSSNWREVARFEGAGEVKSLLQASDGKIYAGTGPGGKIYKSDDGGETWSETGMSGTRYIYSLIEAADGSICAGTGRGVFRSADGGETWQAEAGFPEGTAAYSLLQAQDGCIYAGSEGKIFRANDGGESWSDMGRLNPRCYAVFALAEDRYSVYAGGSSDGGIYMLSGGGWERVAEPGGSGNVYSILGAEDGSAYAAVGREVLRFAPLLDVRLSGGSLAPGDPFYVEVAVQAVAPDFDAYGIITGPAGTYSFDLEDAGTLVPGIIPLATEVRGLSCPLSRILYSVGSIPAGAPPGEYRVTASLVQAGSHLLGTQDGIPGYVDAEQVTVAPQPSRPTAGL